MDSPSPVLGEVRSFPAVSKWIAVSAMHKAVRRGLVDVAVGAAARLFEVDPAYALRRLPVLAFEEVSLADPDLCVRSLVVGTGRGSFAEKREQILLCVRALALSVKCRSLVDLQLVGEHRLVENPLQIVLDLERLGRSRTHELNRQVITLYAMLTDDENVPFVRPSVLETPMVGGIPLCALDMYERHGRRAIAALISGSKPLRAACAGLDRKEVCDLIGRCVFEVEGARVNEELTSHSLDQLHERAVAFELMRAGAKSPEHCWELLRLVEERIGKLHKQRKVAVLGPK